MKNILLFLSLLLPWFFSSIIPFDYTYYNTLTLPFFAPPRWLFALVWPIVYLGIAISTFKLIRLFSLRGIPPRYKKVLLINYLWNQSFPFLFFGLKNPFLGFVSSIGTFISSLFLYEETAKLDEKSTNPLNLYILWGLFATILSLTTYILNLA